MAFMYNEEAYDISLFENQENDVERINIRKDKKKQKEIEAVAQNKKLKIFKVAGILSVSAVAVVLVGIIIMGQVQLTELNQKISNAEEDLKEKQSLYIQTQMKVEAKYSSDIVEESAQGSLGMSKADSYQKEYITIEGGDKAEVSDSEGSNIFDNIAKAISSLWS